MSPRHIPGRLFGFDEIATLWPRLPQRLATHFGIFGDPNGWSSPSQCPIMMAPVLGIFAWCRSQWRAGSIAFANHFLNRPNWGGDWFATDRRGFGSPEGSAALVSRGSRSERWLCP
jgi:hypothetical protein